ncbi:MAG: CerR family C-terminal domain-containing protein [Deltaproteobacteria bacterium]|nr:CerR family C-terminal domain-containing protein [Deltaproteobacteria bacterium]
MDSAEALFAKEGYNGVSIREITAVAQCNQALVHYPFGNKKNLYIEVFRSRWLPREKKVLRCFEKALADLEIPTPKKVVKAFARCYIDSPLTNAERQHQRLLVVRELSNPSEAFELVTEQIIHPLTRIFSKYLKPHLSDSVNEKSLKLHILSIFGTVYYFTYSRTIISHIMGTEYDAAFKRDVIEHIVRFSMGGLPLRKGPIRSIEYSDSDRGLARAAL